MGRSVGAAVVLLPLAEVRQYKCRTNRKPGSYLLVARSAPSLDEPTAARGYFFGTFIPSSAITSLMSSQVLALAEGFRSR